MKARPVLALVAAGTLAGCGVNSIPTADEAVKARWADLQSQYQRRADLIPNIVATVKAAGAQEKSILVEVTQARAQANTVHLTGDDLTDPAKVQRFERVQAGIGTSLQRLQESYPELKSQGNYPELISELEGTENRIGVARRDYNSAVEAYNVRIRTFPDAVGAKIIYGAKPKVPFEASDAAQAAPKVDFGAAG